MSGRRYYGDKKFKNYRQYAPRKYYYKSKARFYGEKPTITKSVHEFELWKLKKEYKKQQKELKKTVEAQTEKDQELLDAKPSTSTEKIPRTVIEQPPPFDYNQIRYSHDSDSDNSENSQNDMF